MESVYDDACFSFLQLTTTGIGITNVSLVYTNATINTLMTTSNRLLHVTCLISLCLSVFTGATTDTPITTTAVDTDMQVISAEEMVRFVRPQCFLSPNIPLLRIFQEKICQQPVAIFTAVQFIAMIPVHIAAMCVLYIKMNKMFNPDWTAMKMRNKNRVKRLTGGQQSRQLWA